MIQKELLDFIKKQNLILDKMVYKDYNEREKVLSIMLKVNEEVGELSDEVLASFGNQRKNKLEGDDNRDNLGGEIADVIITTLLVADKMNIDVEKSINDKIKKINSRFENGN